MTKISKYMVISVTIGAALTLGVTTTALAQANLLTNNAGFESGGTAAHGNGSFTLPGWNIQQYDYKWNSVNVADGGATEGSRRLYINDGGFINTASDSRATVSANHLYELSFDAEKTRDDNTGLWEGAVPSIVFFDSSGNQIKECKGNEIQLTGTYPWQTFKVRALAPAGAVKAGVTMFVTDGTYPAVETHDFSFDNFKLIQVVESKDIVYVRSAPKMVEPGKTCKIKVRYASTGSRTVTARLLNGSGVYGSASQSVTDGRGLLTLNVAVASGAVNSSAYTWEVRSLDSSSVEKAKATVTGVFADNTVSGSGSVNADNSDIVYSGRINRVDPAHPVLYWPGSQIRTRFQGTSIAMRMSTNNKDTTFVDVDFVAVIDGNDVGATHVKVNGTNQTVTLASGLAAGNHTLCLFKNTDVTAWATFHGFNLDAGKGLLRPEPLSAKHIEFYGDSITEGGAPDPIVASPNRDNDGDYINDQFRTYANITARELGMDGHYIAKGGMGIAAGFASYTLRDIWDKFNFDGYTPSSAGTWDFTQWPANVVVIAIGQNDQFGSNKDLSFEDAYKVFVQNVRAKYPNADIFCTNTTMTGPNRMFKAAITPLLSDPKVHFRQFDPVQAHSGHPRADDHQAMATGNDKWYGIADWIEDTLGWDGSASSSAPIGHKVGLKAGISGYFASSNQNFNTYLQASWSTSPGTWETFDVVDAGNGNVALKSEQTGKYVTADLNQASKVLRADWATAIQSWETFTWEPQTDGTFALKAGANGLYVSCNQNDSSLLEAQWAATVGSWEKFTYFDLGIY